MPTRNPTPLPIVDRPIRIVIVGLGQIAELCLPPYVANTDVEVVGLCDLDESRLAKWSATFPGATAVTALDDALALDADVVDALVPTPRHCDVVCRALEAGFHVQVQKPLARSLEEADRMVAAAEASGATLRVLEDDVFFPPLAKLRDIVRSGELGAAQSLHMTIIATPTGGWDVNPASYEWQAEQARDGLGILTFDHGWHQLAVAHWLFGPITRIFGWVRHTDLGGFVLDTPATFVWEHANGVRAVLDIVLAYDMYYRSDYYSDDERVEVVGTSGWVRCTHISGRGVQMPSVVVYRDGETRSFHAIPDLPPDAFAASAAHGIAQFRGEADEIVMDGRQSRDVLRSLLTGLEASKQGRPLDVP